MTDLMVLTEEEVRYFQALLEWEPSDDDDDDIQEKSLSPERPVGQFMFLVLGSKGCGKTSILERVKFEPERNVPLYLSNDAQFCHGPFTAEDRPPGSKEQAVDEERDYRHVVMIDDQTYILNALELPSQHLFDEERLKKALQITEAAVLVYDVNSRASLCLASDIYRRIHEMIEGTRRYGLVLVGNKSDSKDEEREVSWTEGYKLGCTFIETSARTGENIDEVFTQLGREVLQLRWLGRQQREEIERSSVEAPQCCSDVSPSHRIARWKSWARPWFHRRAREGKCSAPY
ncbi:P-loop containing nucleoside triphosphate hydrolase protein [Hypoxylon sp. EC38]|nr:P-loop containing nucleoside triphosphate hydrolase protein [Hypoxylon sp. EC38]